MFTKLFKLKKLILGTITKPFMLILKLYYLKIIFTFFSSRKNIEYCFVKKNKTFPYLKQGSDLDIYLNASSNLLEDLLNYLDDSFILKFKVFNISKNIVHVDLLFNNKLIYKLDFCINKIENSIVKINNDLLNLTITNSENHTFKFSFKKFKISFPNRDYDNLIRYIEYKLYPSKIHHLEFLNKATAKEYEQLKILVEENLDKSLDL